MLKDCKCTPETPDNLLCKKCSQETIDRFGEVYGFIPIEEEENENTPL